MRSFRVLSMQVLSAVTLMAMLSTGFSAQQTRGVLLGRVVDEQEGVIVKASVVVTGPAGLEKKTITDDKGEFVISDLPAGRYTVVVSAQGFAKYESSEVELGAGARQRLNIRLSVSLDPQQVDVATSNSNLSADPTTNADAVVLRGQELEALPEDPDELANALRAMAGAAAGPNGVQFSVDGFTTSGQPLPSRANIREVRINQNPFSAENDRIGFGVVQIFTRPGTQDVHGDAGFIFSDDAFNSRNPFADNRAPYQLRSFYGSLSGSIVPRKASFFMNVARREIDDNQIVNATILDPALNPAPLRLALLTPQRRTSADPRLDYQLNPNHTLVARYSFIRATSENLGVGGFSLPERAYDSTNTIHTLQLTETAIVSSNIVTEFRLQYIHENRRDFGNNSVPTTNVLGAFIEGAPPVGLSSNPETRWWLQNNTTWIVGRNTFRAGMRFRHTAIDDISPDNFAGTFTFNGGQAPQLDPNNQPIRDSRGNVVLVPITSIERFRRTLLFQQQGLRARVIRELGGGASQFSIASGDPAAGTTQIDMGAFVQDDWRLRPSLTISMGLRYETQTNIDTHLNFAPRVAFAWAPGIMANRPARTVVRGGFGIFYDRFGEGFTINANRFNGVTQRQFVVSDPAILDLFPNVPPISLLESNPGALQTLIRVAPDLREPYTIQGAISVERQLPFRTIGTINFVATRGLHMLRSRNINAPLPGTFVPGQPGSEVRPFGNIGDILEYESSGRLNQKQLIFSVNSQLTRMITFFANYTLNKAESDTDGIQTFPANTYDLSTEFGRSAFDVRHVFVFGGSIRTPIGLNFSPLIIANSGRPFNITTGSDLNGDTQFTERPAVAADLNKPGVIVTRLGAFDPNPDPGTSIIPRNFGEGSGFFSVNINMGKAFKLGTAPAAAPQTGGRPGPTPEKPYTFTIAVRVYNLLNRTNAATPVGIIASPFFGLPVSSAGAFGPGGGNPSAGNRRWEANFNFAF